MAEFKNTTIDDTAALKLPAGSTADRSGTPQSGMIRYNTDLDQTEFYDGSTWSTLFAGSSGSGASVEATGGTVVDTTIAGVDYRIHFFTQTGSSNFVVSAGGEIEYLIVAGGGGGGGRIYHGGGGGAGGLLTGTTTVTAQTYTITVGDGGTGYLATSGTAHQGSNSSAFGLTAIGGGGGGGTTSGDGPGYAGGSGGGASVRNTNGGAGTSGQGNAGGPGITGGEAPNYGAGGGGGAGSAGGGGTTTQGGIGGAGISSSISGATTFYAGGGGGSAYNSTTSGRGGIGGGGDGAYGSGGENGYPNTGGGGGGRDSRGSENKGNGNGGSGIVIVRYRRVASPAASADRITITEQPKSFLTINEMTFHVDANSPISYPGSGNTVYDLGSKENNGTFQNSVTFENASTDSYSAFGFNGSNTRISTNFKPSGYRSYFIWIKYNTLTHPSGYQLTGTQEVSAYNYIGIQNGGAFYFYMGTSGGAVSGTSLKAGIWYYQGLTLSPDGNARAYLNAELIDTRSSGVGNTATNEFSIGAINQNHWVDGEISIVEQYNRALNQAEIEHNFNANRWRFGI